MSSATVLVSVGSDHHPFQRLVDWSDIWAMNRPDTRVVVQHGTARAPAHAEARDYLVHAELQSLMSSADAVVVQGGPTAIFEARSSGRLPIVVPRRRDLGEHVDDHQRAFARFLGTTGQAIACDGEVWDFVAALDAAVEQSQHRRVDPTQDAREIAASVERFGQMVADLRPRPILGHMANRQAHRRLRR